MYKNLDKCGISKDFKGRVSFTNRILYPSEPFKDRGLAAVPDKPKQVESTTNVIQEEPTSTNKRGRKSNKGFKVESAAIGGAAGFNSFGPGGMQGMAIGTATPYIGVLDGIIGKDDWYTKRKIYNDIYMYDLSGAVVDLIANLPFSDYTLVGINNPEIIDTYMKTIDNLHLPSLLPSITTDYLVQGAFCGSLSWDDANNRFAAIMPHDLLYCDIKNVNVFGVDPIIDVEIDPDMAELLADSSDPRVQRVKEILPDYIKQAGTSGKIELNPLSTMYIPRRGRSTSNEGNSYFNRIITVHLLEKALIKGTIESAQRRQRAITHIAAGSEDWEPTAAELSELANRFLSADIDPISGVVVTRNDVTVSDVKQGNDFWRWDEVFDFATNAKLRALGVTEDVLTGGSSFNSLEASISLFMDNISRTRDYITRQVFYDKLFPIIACKNNFIIEKNQHAVLSSGDNTDLSRYNGRIKRNRYGTLIGAGTMYGNNSSIFEVGDVTQYEMPTIQWNKQLKPKADKDYMSMLKDMQDAGLPISLRMLAAAGGENIDDLVLGMEDDNDLRLEIAEKKKELLDDAMKEKTAKFLGIENIEELIPAPEQPHDTFAKLEAFTKLNTGAVDRKKKARNLENLDGIYGVREYDSNGHRRILTAERKRQLEDKVHKNFDIAMKELAKKQDIIK